MVTSFRHVQAALAVLWVAAPAAGCLGINDLRPPGTTDASMSDAADGSTVDVGDAWAPAATTHGDATADDVKMGADSSGPACVSGARCSPAECQTGVFTCGGDGGQCTKTANLADGTPCGSGGTSVCRAGTCGTCASGSDCTDTTNPCVKKTIDCSSGQAVCKVAMNAPDGTPCNNGQYCYGGVCSACMVGNACSPASNPCHIGKVTSCAGGTMTCTDQNAPAAAGASCQASGLSSGVCDGNGACGACTPKAICTPPGKPCQQGTMSCTSGPVCGSPMNINEGKSCGSGQICSAGACVACDGASCASGCCDSTGCVTAAQNGGNCGTKGATCAACASSQVCTMGGGGCSCPPSVSTSCNGACTNTHTDSKNCGACGRDCSALRNVSGPVACGGGVCSVPATSCAAGWAHCSANPNDGCETQISQPGTCGSCTTACPATAPKCSGSGNGYTCVTGCSAPTPTLCGLTCVDTTSNASYCGNCATACTGGMTCQSGQCGCPASAPHFCNGQCVASSSSACGSSCAVCTMPQTCGGGGSADVCGCSPTGSCGARQCASVPDGCGHMILCGSCPTGAACDANGMCQCGTGQTNCGSSCANLLVDVKNCSSCGNVCPTPPPPGGNPECLSPFPGAPRTCVGDVGNEVSGLGAAVTLNPAGSVAGIYAVGAQMPAKNGTFLDIATSITLSTSPADLTLALYSDGGGAPGNLLYYHAGNGSATLSTGTLMNGFTGQLFAGGSYWLAVSTNGASAQVTSAAGGGACVFLPWNGTTPPNQAWTGVQACNAGSFEIVLQVTFP